jgi:outer membrane receptor protein involved in Fe transport
MPVLTIPGSSSEGVLTFSVSPEVHLTKTTMLYARIASGYQPGGPNVVVTGSSFPPTFGSSHLVDYQVGLKSSLLDGHATVDLSAFLINWSDIQVAVLEGDGSGILPAGAARSEGFDFSGTWSPVRGLTFASSLAYSDAYLTTAVASLGSSAGARLPYIPMWSGSLSAEYVRAINESWNGFVGGGWRYTGSRYSAVQGSISNFNPANPQGLEAAAFGVIDAHLGAKSGGFTIALFAKNLADRRAYLSPVVGEYDALQSPIDAQAAVLQPRTIGVSIDKTF